MSSKRTKLRKLLLIYLINKRRKQRIQRTKRKRRWWVRTHIREREVHGHYHRLIQTVREHDSESFYR